MKKILSALLIMSIVLSGCSFDIKNISLPGKKKETAEPPAETQEAHEDYGVTELEQEGDFGYTESEAFGEEDYGMIDPAANADYVSPYTGRRAEIDYLMRGYNADGSVREVEVEIQQYVELPRDSLQLLTNNGALPFGEVLLPTDIEPLLDDAITEQKENFERMGMVECKYNGVDTLLMGVSDKWEDGLSTEGYLYDPTIVTVSNWSVPVYNGMARESVRALFDPSSIEIDNTVVTAIRLSSNEYMLISYNNDTVDAITFMREAWLIKMKPEFEKMEELMESFSDFAEAAKDHVNSAFDVENNNQTKLQSGVNFAGLQEFENYNQKKMSGTIVKSTLSLYDKRDIAVVIRTKACIDDANEPWAYNYGALLVGAETANSVSKITQELSQKPGDDWYVGELKENFGTYEYNRDVTGTDTEDSKQYISHGARFQGALIKNKANEVVGMLLTELTE